MKLPAEIERGKPHWKKRQKELLIMSLKFYPHNAEIKKKTKRVAHNERYD